MAYILIPQIKYSHRPAFRLLISAALGAIIYHTGYPIIASIVLLIIALILLINPYEKLPKEAIVWIILFSLPFAFYTDYKAKSLDSIRIGKILYHTNVEILHPVITSAESRIRYKAKVEISKDNWITTLLDVPEVNTIDPGNSFGSIGVGTIDISPLSSIFHQGYRKYLISSGIEATAYLQSIEELHPMPHPPLSSRLQKWRYKLITQFEAISSQHITWQNRGLIYALTLGDSAMLPSSMKQHFSDSGVAHILALSGYHLGVVMWLFSILIGRILWRHKWRRLRYSIIIILLVGYTLFSGASTATVRALLMSCIALGGKLINRAADPIQLLSLVMLIFLVINPFAYYSVGLLLSVSAVWGIYSFCNLFERLLNPSNRVLRWFGEVICMTISAQIGVLPLLFMYFGTAPLTFIWSNIPLVFLSGILIPLALASFILMLIFGTLPSLLLEVLNFLSACMNAVTNLFSTHPWSLDIHFDSISLLLYYISAYLFYCVLYNYTCHVEIKRLIRKETEPY